MSALPDPIGTLLERDEDERRLARNWRGTRERMARRRGHRPVVGGFALAAAAALVAFWLWPEGTPGPLRLVDGAAPVAVEVVAAPRALTFDDASRLELAPGSRVVPRVNDGARFELSLERGLARFEVTPGGARVWRVDAGIATVEVLGTAFVVERGARTLRVAVERGRVRVESALLDDPRTLGAGESLVLEAPLPPEVAETPSEASSDAAPGPSHGAVAEALGDMAADGAANDAADGSRAASADASRWRALAERGEHRAAYEALSPSGLSARTREASARELLLLADVARLSGHPRDAVAPLERFLGAHADDVEAPLAAITLARIELGAGRHDRAAAAFARARALGVPSAFAAEVCAGLAIAQGRSGDVSGAATVARECLATHARPPHLDALRELVGGDGATSEGRDSSRGAASHASMSGAMVADPAAPGVLPPGATTAEPATPGITPEVTDDPATPGTPDDPVTPTSSATTATPRTSDPNARSNAAAGGRRSSDDRAQTGETR